MGQVALAMGALSLCLSAAMRFRAPEFRLVIQSIEVEFIYGNSLG